MNPLTPLIVIVDIEHLHISPALEQSISRAFGGISLLKIAVGDGRKLNDEGELLTKGYYLFHRQTEDRNVTQSEIDRWNNLLQDGEKIVIVSNDRVFIDWAKELVGAEVQ